MRHTKRRSGRKCGRGRQLPSAPPRPPRRTRPRSSPTNRKQEASSPGSHSQTGLVSFESTREMQFRCRLSVPLSFCGSRRGGGRCFPGCAMSLGPWGSCVCCPWPAVSGLVLRAHHPARSHGGCLHCFSRPVVLPPPRRAAEGSPRQLRAPRLSPEGACPGAAGRGQAHPGRRQRLQTQGGNTSVQRRPSPVVAGALCQVGSGLTASACRDPALCPTHQKVMRVLRPPAAEGVGPHGGPARWCCGDSARRGRREPRAGPLIAGATGQP